MEFCYELILVVVECINIVSLSWSDDIVCHNIWTMCCVASAYHISMAEFRITSNLVLCKKIPWDSVFLIIKVIKCWDTFNNNKYKFVTKRHNHYVSSFMERLHKIDQMMSYLGNDNILHGYNWFFWQFVVILLGIGENFFETDIY